MPNPLFYSRTEPRKLPESQRAAQIQGRTLTDFVVSAAQEAARQTIEATEIVRLSVEDQQRFAEAILNPPEPTAALHRAFARHRELFGAE